MKHRRRAAAILAALAFVLACDRSDLISPQPDFAPAFSSGGPGFVLPVPEPAGYQPWIEAGTLRARKWAVVRIQGKIDVTKHPDFEACDPAHPVTPLSAGPLGLPSSPTLLRVGLYSVGLSFPVTLDGDSSAVVSSPVYSPADQPLSATRSGGPYGTKDNCPNGPAPYYKIAGVQHVIIEELPDPKSRALATLVPSAQSVEFMATDIPPGGQVKWLYYAGDTLATPTGYYGYAQYSPCYDKKSCTYPVSASGRMYVGLNANGGIVWYPGDVVWVGKTPSAKLVMTCDPTSVYVGGTTSCTAATEPAGAPMHIQEWYFTGDSLSRSQGSFQSQCGPGINPCVVAVNQSGAMNVRATVGGLVQTASAELTALEWPIDGGSGCSGDAQLRPQGLFATAATASEDCAPPPMLDCESVERGLEATCRILGLAAGDGVVGFKFESIELQLDTIINGPSDSIWKGVVVASGVVSALILRDSSKYMPSDTLSVLPRTSWGWSASQWTFSDTTGNCIAENFVEGARGGRNSNADCTNPRVLPRLVSDTVAQTAFGPAPVVGGPNSGLWFVHSAFFRMERVSTLNRDLKAGAGTYALHEDIVPPNDPGQFFSCREALQRDGTEIQITVREFNVICKSVAFQDYVDAVQAHEGFGNPAIGGRGHEALARSGASEPEGDPYKATEALLGQSYKDLFDEVFQAVGIADEFISNHSKDVYGGFGNWQGTVWALKADTSPTFFISETRVP